MVYDQAQSPRLGQRVPVESTFVQVFDVDPSTLTADLVEAAWPGMLIYRNDTSMLMIYDGEAQGWRDVVGGVAGQLTYVGNEMPTGGSYNIGDTWYDQDAGMKAYVWDGDSWEPTISGIKTFRQPGIPTSTAIGDIWYDSDAGQKMYRANAVNVSVIAVEPDLGWVLVRDEDIDEALGIANSAQSQATNALADAAEAIAAAELAADAAAAAQTTANQAALDAAAAEQTGDDAQAAADQAALDAAAALAEAADAIAAADAAQSAADSKANIFYMATAPTSGMVADDLWVDTDNGVLSVYQGGSWVVTQDLNLLSQANTQASALATAARTQAEITAAADATAKANAAQGAATTAAAADATTKAAAAQAAAIAAASADATTKASAAQAAATAVANAAQADADQAIADAADAQSTADEKVQSFFQTTAPTGMVAGDVGDLWFDTDDQNKMYRWSGSAWTLSDDQRIAATVTAANNAQTTANSKIVTFYTTSPPSATTIGDLWVDTDDGNKLYRASATGSGSWVSVQDASIASASAAASAAQTAATNAMTAAQTAQATADGAIRTYYAATPPWANGATGHANDAGDMWFDTDDGQAYRWNDLTKTWEVIEDQSIGAALAAAQNAQTTADGKVTAYYAIGAPWTSGHATDVGDLWYDTDDANKAYFWDGDSWEVVQNTVITNAANTAQTNAIATAAADATTKAGAAQSAAISTAAGDATTKAAAAQAAAIASSNSFTDAKFPITSTQITDDAITTPKLDANAITAKHTLTGPVIQTTATAARGIKMSNTGLTAYTDGSISGGPAAGTAMLVINGNSGSIQMRGDLTSGSTITGANLVGGLIKTEATTGRGIEMSSGGLILYAPSPTAAGTPQVTMDSATGYITLAGALLGGGTIVGPTFKTTQTANRGIQINSAALIGFDAAGASTFVLNASTGALTMVGPVLSGGTITGAMFQTNLNATQGVKLGTAGMTFYDTANQPVLNYDVGTGILYVKGAIKSGSTIEGASITGDMSVTSGKFQTDAAANTGIEITSSGLIAYGGGVPKLTISGSTGDVILAGNLTGGGFITGPEFRTHVSATQGIHINSTGLYGYDASNNLTFSLNASTGALTLKGTIDTGSTITGTEINGSTITGGLIRTSDLDNTGIKIHNTGLAAYGPGESPVLAVDYITGAVTLAGPFLTGGTITGASVNIGGITIDPTNGMRIPQTNGNEIRFPTDGSEAIIQARAVLSALTLKGDGVFYGTSGLSGTFKANNGVPDPTVGPTMSYGWPRTELKWANGTPEPLLAQGLLSVTDNAAGTQWILYTSSAGFYSAKFIWVDKATQLVVGVYGPTTGWNEYQSVQRTSTGIWGIYKAAQTSWIAELLTSSGTGNMVRTVTYTQQLVTSNRDFTYSEVWGADGADLLLANYSTQSNSIPVYRTTPVVNQLGSPSVLVTLNAATVSNTAVFRYIGRGTYDLGATRWVLAYGTNARAWDTSGATVAGTLWTLDFATTPMAMGWDGTRFWTFDNTPSMSKYAAGNLVTPTNVWARYAWEDVNATGGTHHTNSSPAIAYPSWIARSFLTVAALPAPVSTTGQDDANSVRIYVGGASNTCYLQTVQPPLGSATASYDGTLLTSGTLAPTTSDFGTLGITGSFESVKQLSGNPAWQLKGDGSARVGSTQVNTLGDVTAGGLVPPGSVQMYVVATAPPGWLLCNGAAVSRVTYQALWDVLRQGTSSSPYGNGDGSTTFNVPNFLGRAPMGHYPGGGYAASMNTQGGESSHAITVAEIQGHIHRETIGYDGSVVYVRRYDFAAASDIPTTGRSTFALGGAVSGAARQEYTDIDGAYGGARTPINVLDPYTTVTFIIKT